MKIGIIDYGAGNIASVTYALNRMGIDPVICSTPESLAIVDKVIFPGVGAAGAAMNKLKQSGLDIAIPQLTKPVLGICLGMQLLCVYSEEGDTNGLGIFDQQAVRFRGSEKVPHMGWNSLSGMSSPLFKGVEENSFAYFVHSYFVPTGHYTIAGANYMGLFSAALQRDNFYALQFHPEKSGTTGLQILKNFLDL